MLASAFRSPATNPARTVSIPGSMLPACRFASSQPLPRPVRPFAPPPSHRFAPASAASTLMARCRFHDQPGLPLPRPPLPFGTVRSLRIKAFCRIRCKLVRLPKLPDPRSLPAAESIASLRLRINVPESLPLRRLAVPQYLLEPPSLCSRARFPSIDLCDCAALFRNFYLACNQTDSRGNLSIPCG
jgi:hypothetical protein